MIQSRQAPVRPRVISETTGDSLLLEDEVRSLLEAGARGVILVGGPGAGKTTALEHLAAVFGNRPGLSFHDDLDRSSQPPRAKKHGCVIATATRQIKGFSRVACYRLAPWSLDDWLEYLRAVHPDRCASVMARLRAAGSDPFEGLPLLWRAVLDEMAADEALRSPREALRRHLGRYLTTPEMVAAVASFALKVLRRPKGLSAEDKLRLTSGWPVGLVHLLCYHVLLMLAADKIATDLIHQGRCSYFHGRFPRELVREASGVVALLPEALAHLKTLLVDGNAVVQPMAASILHATNTGWVPDPRRVPLLKGAYLTGAAWPDVSLAGVNIRKADLNSADLRRANLDGARAVAANLRSACLQRASLRRINARAANLAAADLSFARAEGAYLSGANLARANLEKADLVSADLAEADLTGACLCESDLRRAALVGVKLAGADFSGADLTDARLDCLTLREACFLGARFVGAGLAACNLEGMELPGADFTGANLENALLTGSLMPDACFDRAWLRGAGLAEVSWERASLRGADLTGASFHLGSARSGLVGSPIACEGSRTGFYTDDFDEQDFKPPEEIRKANLRCADLRGARIKNVDFYLVDLRDALLDPEQQEHARRCGAILESRV
jgi:uncharacterized protein YjbI with pentapeptide repeats